MGENGFVGRTNVDVSRTNAIACLTNVDVRLTKAVVFGQTSMYLGQRPLHV